MNCIMIIFSFSLFLCERAHEKCKNTDEFNISCVENHTAPDITIGKKSCREYYTYGRILEKKKLFYLVENYSYKNRSPVFFMFVKRIFFFFVMNLSISIVIFIFHEE